VGAFDVDMSALGSYLDSGKLGYNPHKNSLYVIGHHNNQEDESQNERMTEINIPEARMADFLMATQLEDVERYEVSQGTFSLGDKLGSTGSGGVHLWDMLVYEDDLIVSAHNVYSTNGDQAALMIRPSDLAIRNPIASASFVPYPPRGDSASVQVFGQFRPEQGVTAEDVTFTSRMIAGHMAHIPAAWQETLGGTILAGLRSRSIVGNSSLGPAAFAINPATDFETERFPVRPLVVYPERHHTLGEYGIADNTGTPETTPQWNPSEGVLANMCTTIEGAIFPDGTDSVLFLGAQGMDDCYYAAGPVASVWETVVWAYNANDFLAADQPWDVLPRSALVLDTEYPIRGSAFDQERSRLYILVFIDDDHGPLPPTGARVLVFDVGDG